MDNKINFYGFETGVLLEKLDKVFDHYACNNKELNYGFYNENSGFFLEKDYKENLKYIRDYVDQGVDGTYGVISFQGSVEIGGEDYKNIKDNDCDLTNMYYSFFKDLSSIEYSVCKKDGKLVENFLEDEIKKLVASKIEKDCPVDMLHLTDRAKYCLKASGITTLKGLLKTPLYDMKNLKNIGKKGYPSIRGELNRICYDIQFNKEQDRINKFIEIEEEMDEIEK